MKNEIVVGFDASPPARAALAWTAGLAWATGWPVRALHIIDRAHAHDMFTEPVIYDRIYDSVDDVDVDYRRPITQAFAEVGPEPHWSLQFGQGHAGRVLVDRSRHARLLVLGTHEHVGWQRMLVGSAGHYCVSHAVCSVVVIPQSSPDQE